MTGSNPNRGRNCSHHHHIQTDSGAQLALYPKGTKGSFFKGIKWLQCEAKNSPPTSSEVKNEWSFTLTPPYVFTVQRLQHGQLYLSPYILITASYMYNINL